MVDSVFPIRYGILECDEKINCTPSGASEFFNIKTYMACKCYVISEIRKYRPDGSIDEQYEVVFLYQKLGNDFRRDEPIFSGLECTNKVGAKLLFTDYDSASKAADQLNDNSFKVFATNVPYDSNYGLKVKTGKSNFDQIRGKYKEKEQQLEEFTKNLNGRVKRIEM